MSVTKQTKRNSQTEAAKLHISNGMKATLQNYRHAPRKVRLVADLIRGKKLDAAVSVLSFLPKKAALPLKKLIESAAANAKQAGKDKRELLKIGKISVDKGLTLTRSMPRARGRSTPIRKHSSHITLELVEVAQK